MTYWKAAVIVLTLALNGLFAAFEMALASVPRARLMALASQKRAGAKAALAMKQRMEASLAVVQVGITVAGAVGASVGGVGIEQTLSPVLENLLRISRSAADSIVIAGFVVVLSTVTIVFAELVPKVFAIRNAELVCLQLAPAMQVLAAVIRPVVAAFEWIVKIVTAGGQKLLGRAAPGEERQSLYELHAAVAMARTARLIGANEERILLSAAQLPSRAIADIMVPAESISMLSAGSSLVDALLAAHLDLHTRFPVCTVADDPQSIAGYVTFKDIVVALKMEAKTADLRGITRPIRRFRRSESIARVLETMVRERVHVALVADEAGAVLGMVTLEDIMEELVGEIEDEFDRLPSYLVRTESGCIAGGGARMGSIAAALQVAAPYAEGTLAGATVADWCAGLLDRPVEKGETIRGGGLVLTVRKLRRRKIAECFISRASEHAPGP